jgi:hypothetical protein
MLLHFCDFTQWFITKIPCIPVPYRSYLSGRYISYALATLIFFHLAYVFPYSVKVCSLHASLTRTNHVLVLGASLWMHAYHVRYARSFSTRLTWRRSTKGPKDRHAGRHKVLENSSYGQICPWPWKTSSWLLRVLRVLEFDMYRRSRRILVAF